MTKAEYIRYQKQRRRPNLSGVVDPNPNIPELLKVVLPVCEKDEHLAILNLEICRKLDGVEPFECFIVYEHQFHFDRIVAEAEKTFKEVSIIGVPKPLNPNWPGPPNAMWQEAARHFANQMDAWLWWEPDAVPLASGWIQTLFTEYQNGNKLFMGAWVNQNEVTYMAGVGIYPPIVHRFTSTAMTATHSAFDIELGKTIEASCHKTMLIKHELQPRNGLSNDECRDIVSSGAVLFHKCKDGSLHRFMLGDVGVLSRLGSAIKKVVGPSSRSQITVVITNYQRPQMLLRAFKSCVAAGVKNLVVSSSGATTDVKAIHAQILREMPGAVIESIDDDLGCNEMWLRGVKRVKTEWCHILHDDDWLLPGFSVLEKLVSSTDEKFFLWPGQDSRSASNRVTPFPTLKTGVYSSFAIKSHLMTPGKRSISPVAGLFKTKDLIEVLEECERSLTGPEFHYRPTMMVGNDLMIWLRISDKYPRFVFLETPLVVFGAWDHSVTYEDVVVNRGQPSKLDPIYNATRAYAKAHPSPYIQTHKTKTAVFCYVPDPGYIGLNRFFENMNEYRTNSDLIYLSDVPCLKAPGLIPIPSPVISTNFRPQPGHPDLSNPKGLVGTMAWMFALKIALENGIDHLLYLETDCRITCDDWDKKMFDEYFAWKHGIPMCGGSPVCWHPFVHGYEWDKLVIEYAFEYQKASGMAMAFEGTPKTQCWLYPNGALSILNVKEVAALWPVQINDPVRYCMELIPFDLALGIKMTTTLKEDTFKRMAWLSCSYSGCKNHHVTEERRMAMIKGKEKVAVHEVKREDI